MSISSRPLPIWITGLVAWIAFVALACYAVQNRSGHTGFEPWLLSVIFAASLAVGSIGFVYSAPRRAAAFALIAGLAGLALLICLDRFNVLLQYDRCISRGMP